MKKALAILMILALVGSAAFAEITFGAWGRGLFVPVYNTGASGFDSTATNKASWGGAPRIGFTIAGNSDNVGFKADIKADGGAIAANDEQKIWVKPVSQVKLELGRVQNDTLRGNADYGSWNWDRAFGDGSTGEDFTFTRLSTGSAGSATYDNKQGVIAEITPTDALFVGVALRDVNGDNQADNKLTENLAKNAQFAAGYTIANVGLIRAQIIRNYLGAVIDDNLDQYEVAFRVTSIQNLTADVGLRMWSNTDYTKRKEISAVAAYKLDKATLHASTQIDLNDKMDTYDNSGDMGLYVGGGVDYSLDGGIGLSADVRYWNGIKVSSDDAKTTFFAGVTKGFSNGLIGIGYEMAKQTDSGYSIPVRFEYWF